MKKQKLSELDESELIGYAIHKLCKKLKVRKMTTGLYYHMEKIILNCVDDVTEWRKQ